MIIDTMRFGEAAAHIARVKAAAIPKILHILQSKKKDYQRIVNNRGDKRCNFKPIPFERERVQFYLCPYSMGKKEFKKNGVRFYVIAKIPYKKNTYWCMTNIDNTVDFYKIHFFQRYQERHCGMPANSPVSMEEVRAFFDETDTFVTYKQCPSEGHPNGVLGGSYIGTSCGDLVDGVYVWRTFVDASTARFFKKQAYDQHPKNCEMFAMVA